ncbi:MAG: Ig-like domain-containing protein, partial [Clostridia bacterium]
MEEKPVKKQRKYGIPLIAVLCLLFLIAAIVLYFVTGEKYVSYYYEDDSELTLVSASPSDAGGVSQDSAIVLEWNRPVSIDVADEVVLSPSARGKWTVSGNQLIFTPQQLAAGTYYTVFIPKGTRLNQRGDVLEEDIFFSFETENPDIRVPADTAFSVDGRSFSYSDEETVSIPVSLLNEKNSTVEVSVYRAESPKAFTKAFSELFSYPSWAELSIGNFQAEERNFDKVSSSEMAVRGSEGTSFVNLGSLPEGQYLVRLAAAGRSYDVAVTVSRLRLGMVYDHGVLSLWAMRTGTVSDEAVAGGKVTVNGTSVFLDENGFASFGCGFEGKKIYEDSSVLAVTLADESDEVVFFLSVDDVTPVYDGDLFLDRLQWRNGDTLQASGGVFSDHGVPAKGTAMLLLCSSVGVLEASEITLENGYFSHQWDDLALADGEYRIVLSYDGMSLATDTVSVGEKNYELNLSVTANKDSIASGENVTYHALVSDPFGQPVSDAVVSINGGDGIPVDSHGEAVFRETYRVNGGLASVQKNAVFRVDSPYGTAEEVTVSTSVYSASRTHQSEKQKEEPSGDGLKMPLVLENGVFSPADEEEVPTYYMEYKEADHTFTITAAGGRVTFTSPGAISADGGETITFTAESDSVSRRITSVSFCKGKIPDALCGKNLYNESLQALVYGTLEETRVFFGNEAVAASFSTENRDGDYFIRLASKDLNGQVVSRYIPVKIHGVSLQCPDTSSYVAGHVVTLPFSVDSDESLNYCLTIGEEEYLGTAEGNFSVSVDISDAGQYSGEIKILKEDTVVASKEFDFAVYQKLPMFYTARKGASEQAFLTCRVKKDCADEFLTMFEIMALPGDQILQRMGKTLFYQAFGDQIPGDFSDMNFNLTSLQNSDGGFSRFEYAESDLLLSVLVSEQKDFLCDRDSLRAYLQYRLTTADNPETAALACWGLTCFGYDCS